MASKTSLSVRAGRDCLGGASAAGELALVSRAPFRLRLNKAWELEGARATIVGGHDNQQQTISRRQALRLSSGCSSCYLRTITQTAMRTTFFMVRREEAHDQRLTSRVIVSGGHLFNLNY